MLDNRNVRRALLFSFEAALCWVLAGVLRTMADHMSRQEPTKVSFAAIIFLLLIDFCLALINLLPAVIARSMIPGRQMDGQDAAIATAIHYVTFFMLFRIPYLLVTGRFHIGYLPAVGSLIAYIAWMALSYAAAYSIVSTPPIAGASMNELIIPMTESEKCVTALGDYMTLLAQTLGERRRMEKLWNPVYSYVKDLPKIQKLVLNKGLKYDEIVLNAVGGIAFKLLASGELHAAPGTLSPDGEYVRKVWWVTANELVKRTYNRPEDVTQGLEALDAAILSAGFPK